MQLVCPCLNVTVNVVAEDGDNFVNDALVRLERIQDLCDDEAVEDDFFAALCSGGNVARFVLDNEKGIVEKLPVLVKRRHVGRWEIRRCLLCNADACALGSNCVGQVLVNMKLLLHEDSVIAERRKSSEISPIFQVILPQGITKDDFADSSSAEMNNTITAGRKSGFTHGATSMVSSSALHAIQACIGHYLRKEQELMEDRIRVFSEQQQAAFDQLKAEATTEKKRVLSLLVQRGGSGYNTSSESYWSSGSTSLGGIGMGAEDEVDSAVPLSPLSLTSGGDPSPGPDASRAKIGVSLIGNTDGFTVPARPKAHSNPASLSGWKRKRHSGGPGAPSLSCHPEEQQDIFSFEEQENDEFNRTSYLPADDEGDTTDDSGTGEDCSKFSSYYPPPPAGVGFQRRTVSVSDTKPIKYCLSLPVNVPQRATDRRSPKYTNDMPMSEIEKEPPIEVENETNPKDVGASMQALAKSIQNADDPERLFGERPQRRRYKTGQDITEPVQNTQQDPFQASGGHKSTVVVVYQTNQDIGK